MPLHFLTFCKSKCTDEGTETEERGFEPALWRRDLSRQSRSIYTFQTNAMARNEVVMQRPRQENTQEIL